MLTLSRRGYIFNPPPEFPNKLINEICKELTVAPKENGFNLPTQFRLYFKSKNGEFIFPRYYGLKQFDASKLGQTSIPLPIQKPEIAEQEQRKIRTKEVFCEEPKLGSEPDPDYYFISKFNDFFKLNLDINNACSSISEYRQALDEIKRKLKLRIDLLCKMEELRQFGIIEVEEYKDNVKKIFIECVPRLLEFYNSILSI